MKFVLLGATLTLRNTAFGVQVSGAFCKQKVEDKADIRAQVAAGRGGKQSCHRVGIFTATIQPGKYITSYIPRQRSARRRRNTKNGLAWASFHSPSQWSACIAGREKSVPAHMARPADGRRWGREAHTVTLAWGGSSGPCLLHLLVTMQGRASSISQPHNRPHSASCSPVNVHLAASLK